MTTFPFNFLNCALKNNLLLIESLTNPHSLHEKSLKTIILKAYYFNINFFYTKSFTTRKIKICTYEKSMSFVIMFQWKHLGLEFTCIINMKTFKTIY